MAKEKEEEQQTTDETVDEISRQESDEALEKQDQTSADADKDKDEKSSGPKKNKLKQLWHWTATHKKISIPVAVVLVLLVLAAVPFTRLTISGLFVKQTIAVEVVDSETGRSVSSADVSINGVEASTDEEGRAQLSVNVGYRQLDVSKKYYEGYSSEVTVPITKTDPFEVSLKATGRAVPVTVVNTISNEPVANATLAAEETEVQTDEEGTALIVVPADKSEVEATISGEGFNDKNATLTVTSQQVTENNFDITPKGKVYFLSNLSGTIDVVKTNLDGTDRQTVLKGTGNEDRRSTVLLASRDWRYLALESKRNGGEYSKLFLIDTSDDSVTVMDEGEATFDLAGWSGHNFVYEVDRVNNERWEPKKQALKSYNAEAEDIVLLDDTAAGGDNSDFFYEWIGRSAILAEEIVYTKNVRGSHISSVEDKEASLWSIKSDGADKRKLAGYSPNGSSYQGIDTRVDNPNKIYYAVNYGNNNLYEYEGGGSVEEVQNMTSSDLYEGLRTTYLVSPDGDRTFWSETRDGKSAILTGNAVGDNENQIAVLDDYNSYGWFTDNYLLVSKENHELYIMPRSGVESESELVKVSDYYKPDLALPGYGYGYGGF